MNVERTIHQLNRELRMMLQGLETLEKDLALSENSRGEPKSPSTTPLIDMFIDRNKRNIEVYKEHIKTINNDITDYYTDPIRDKDNSD